MEPSGVLTVDSGFVGSPFWTGFSNRDFGAPAGNQPLLFGFVCVSGDGGFDVGRGAVYQNWDG